jgi:hypothetical protein
MQGGWILSMVDIAAIRASILRNRRPFGVVV